MKWQKIAVYARPEAEELLSDVFLSAGAQGVNIEGGDISGAAGGDYIEEQAAQSGEFAVNAYFAMDGTSVRALGDIEKRLEELDGEVGAWRLETEEVDEDDWANAWKAYFKPERISGQVVIKPTWEEYTPLMGDIVIEIDPGMAFGTGTHESTRMCVRMLEKYMPENADVIDVGCGSGILSVAALRLGAGRVWAMDHDSVAVEVAKENLALNGCMEHAQVMQSDLFSALDAGVKGGVVVANIIADIIIRLAPDVKGRLNEDGVFICSGIIDSRAREVEAALRECGLDICEVAEDGEWRAIVCRAGGEAE